LGTVNGFSPRLRIDVMINAMVNSYFENGNIKVFAGNIHRPILGIKDLGRAIETIIECKDNHSGIYNLASFNSTPAEIAAEVANIMGCEVIEDRPEPANISKPYDFEIDCSKFAETFNFEFIETVESITTTLKNNFNQCTKTSRHCGVEYK